MPYYVVKLTDYATRIRTVTVIAPDPAEADRVAQETDVDLLNQAITEWNWYTTDSHSTFKSTA